jgi:hypothetical protein
VASGDQRRLALFASVQEQASHTRGPEGGQHARVLDLAQGVGGLPERVDLIAHAWREEFLGLIGEESFQHRHDLRDERFRAKGPTVDDER